MVIGPQILNPAGMAMDQDGDFEFGEEPDDQYPATFTRLVTSPIIEDTVWGPIDPPIIIPGRVIINPGVTLTIEAGSTIKFASSAGFDVNGTLDIRGTLEEPVVLTSWRDDAAGGDTNGDGNATSPASGNWRGIWLTGVGASARLDYSDVRYADYGIETAAAQTSWNATNSIFRNNNFGVAAHHQQGLSAKLTNCLIADNRRMGVYYHEYFNGIIRNTTIVGNGFGGGWGASGVHQVGTLTMENSIVAFNRNGFDTNVQSPTLRIRNSLFYNPAVNELNGITSDILQRDGNTVADPLFVDRLAGNYQLGAGSPAIDSGYGTVVPAKDILGRARYNDRGMPNVGNGYPSYVDMGAYERQEVTDASDLAVTYVSIPQPEFLGAGETFTVEWIVTNVGTVETKGNWQDLVYLSGDPYLGGDELLATVDHTDPLTPGESYTETLTATVPIASGPKYILIHTNATWNKCYMEWASAVKLKYNERPVFKELMQVIQPRDHLVIWRVDRLGGEFFGSMACLEWIQDRRIVIHSIEEFGAVPIDLNSALGRVMVALLAGAKDLTNEHSRKAIAQALAWHKRRGLAYGPTPIGKRRIEVARGSKVYKVDVYDADDLEVIREIAARRAMNDGWAEIGRELERRQLTLNNGRPWAPRRKKGKYKGCLVQETMQRSLKHYLEHVEPKGFNESTAYFEAERIVSQILGDRSAVADPVPASPFISS